jgi:hypothetical protein
MRQLRAIDAESFCGVLQRFVEILTFESLGHGRLVAHQAVCSSVG